jgi:hypothetical protein
MVLATAENLELVYLQIGNLGCTIKIDSDPENRPRLIVKTEVFGHTLNSVDITITPETLKRLNHMMEAATKKHWNPNPYLYAPMCYKQELRTNES